MQFVLGFLPHLNFITDLLSVLKEDIKFMIGILCFVFQFAVFV